MKKYYDQNPSRYSLNPHKTTSAIETNVDNSLISEVAIKPPEYEQVGRKFLADMIDRVGFIIVSICTATAILAFLISVVASRNAQLELIDEQMQN